MEQHSHNQTIDPLSRFLRKCDETGFWAFESAILRNQYFGNFYPPPPPSQNWFDTMVSHKCVSLDAGLDFPPRTSIVTM